jgi:hypothetical protein
VWADVSSCLFRPPGQSENDLWCWLELFQDAKEAFPTGESIWQHGDSRPGLFCVVYAWPEGGGVEAIKELLGQKLMITWKATKQN